MPLSRRIALMGDAIDGGFDLNVSDLPDSMLALGASQVAGYALSQYAGAVVSDATQMALFYKLARDHGFNDLAPTPMLTRGKVTWHLPALSQGRGRPQIKLNPIIEEL
jgi:hypothetical protein